MRQLSIGLVTVLLLGTFAAFAQEKTMTGCLSKDASGYMLTDEKSGAKTTVTGSADLEKHSANHKVTLTGTAKTDAGGKTVLEVSKIQHVAATCKAPSQ